MMATVPHVTSGLGLRKFQADGFLLTRVYKNLLVLKICGHYCFNKDFFETVTLLCVI